MLDDDQAELVRELRKAALGPREIALRIGVDTEDVRAFLQAEGLDRRPRLVFEPMQLRAVHATDLLTPSGAASHLGIGPDTLLRWVRERHLPFRDALGHLTDEQYDGRWCHFSRAELDRWTTGLGT